MDDAAATPWDWSAVPVAEVAAHVRGVAATARRPVMVAVDGRSGAGKSTVADQLADALDGAPIIHTDDVAWHHSFFDWWPLMREHILEPLRLGRPVSWRPPTWVARQRPGSIVVPVSCHIIVEGVSASRLELEDLLDVAIWVEGDIAEQERRGVARDGADAAAQRFWNEWQAVERPLLERDRPWSRADLLILGTSREAAAPGTWWAHWGPGRQLGDPPAG